MEINTVGEFVQYIQAKMDDAALTMHELDSQEPLPPEYDYYEGLFDAYSICFLIANKLMTGE